MKPNKTAKEVRDFVNSGASGVHLCYFQGSSFKKCQELSKDARDLQQYLETLHDRKDVFFYQQIVERENPCSDYKYYIHLGGAK